MINFSDLNKITEDLPVITYNLDEETVVEIKQYLPIIDKINLISRVIECAGNDEEGFFNIIKLDVFYQFEMIRTYTNIEFTDEELNDIPTVYDIIQRNNLNKIIEEIPESERKYIWDNILELAREITNYNHSALGILKTLQKSKDNLDLDVNAIMGQLNDPNALTTLKDILGLTGLIE